MNKDRRIYGLQDIAIEKIKQEEEVTEIMRAIGLVAMVGPVIEFDFQNVQVRYETKIDKSNE